MLLSSNCCVAFLEVCSGSLSCWNILSSSGTSNFSKLSTTPSSKISQYCCASIIPCTSVSFLTPFHPIHPHTIKLFPPPCLTVGWWSCLKVVPPSASKYKPSHLTQSC